MGFEPTTSSMPWRRASQLRHRPKKRSHYNYYNMFKDRVDAGRQLTTILSQKMKEKKDLVVVSLLRGGAIIGDEIAKKLNLPHLTLPVAKIGAPNNEELAVGAMVFKEKFYNPQTVSWYDQKALFESEFKARKKLLNYCRIFNIKENDFNCLKEKTVILTDDGAATGSSLKAAALFLKKKKVKKIILALPVAPADFDTSFFDESFILHQDPYLSAVSQFYQDFSSVDENMVKKILRKN